MVGCKITATYIPVEGASFLTPAPGAVGAWGDAYDAWVTALNAYNAGEFSDVGPGFEGPPEFGTCDYINTSDALTPVIRMTATFVDGFQAPYTLFGVSTAVHEVFDRACSDATVTATMAAFSSTSMELAKTTIEQWSDEATP